VVELICAGVYPIAEIHPMNLPLSTRHRIIPIAQTDSRLFAIVEFVARSD
jgi:hypothetical protein